MHTNDGMGEVLDGEPPALRYVRRLPHSPDTVWRALTESEHLHAWLPCDIVGDRVPGGAIELPFWPEVVAKHGMEYHAVLPGRINVWEPPRVFEWTWDTDVVRFELEPHGTGTTLTLTTWLSSGGPAGLSGTAAGYHVCLDHLEQLLDTGSAPPVADADPTALEARYEAVLAGDR